MKIHHQDVTRDARPISNFADIELIVHRDVIRDARPISNLANVELIAPPSKTPAYEKIFATATHHLNQEREPHHATLNIYDSESFARKKQKPQIPRP